MQQGSCKVSHGAWGSAKGLGTVDTNKIFLSITVMFIIEYVHHININLNVLVVSNQIKWQYIK